MIISSRKNQFVVKARGIVREKSVRDAENIFAAEGEKLCGEALAAGMEIVFALVTISAAKKFPDCVNKLAEKSEIIYVTDEIYSYVSEQKSPQGIFIVIKALDKSVNIDKILSSKKILILDEVQDPGNLGTMLRTAEALGIDGAVLSADCADAFSPKALRSSMGTAFRLPLLRCEAAPFIEKLKISGFTVYAAVLDETAESLDDIKFPERSAVIIGNEGHGVSESCSRLCRKLYIPISGAQSLNAAAAAAIICRQLAVGQKG